MNGLLVLLIFSWIAFIDFFCIEEISSVYNSYEKMFLCSCTMVDVFVILEILVLDSKI